MRAGELDPEAILAALGVGAVTALAPVSGGADTALWRVEHGGVTSALRVFRAEQAAMARREAVVMAMAVGAGLPVPEVRAEGVWRDRPALLLSWCAGSTIKEALGARPWRAGAIGVSFGQAQAAIHGVRAPDILRQQPDAWIAWAGPDHHDLRAWLRESSGCPDALLHLDYHPLNVLTGGARITGVLDWANARAGDPRADLARTLTILRLETGRLAGPPLLKLLTRVVVRLFERGWRQGYRQVAGPTRGMAPFYAWAGAVMARDLAPRRGKPGSGLTPEHFARIDRWTAHWKRRAGCPT